MSEGPRLPGRRMAVVGMVLCVVAVVGGILGISVLGGKIDTEVIERSVIVSGETAVPGELDFSVDEPLRGGKGEMSVAVGTTSPSSSITCAIAAADGQAVDTRRAGASDTFVDSAVAERFSVAVVAPSLEPGDYVASCEAPGEPSADNGMFTVSRVLVPSEIFALAGPALGILGVLFLAGVMGLVGVVLLVAGLVTSGRHRRAIAQGLYPTGLPQAPPTSPAPWQSSPWAPPGQQPPAAQPPGPQPPGQPAVPDPEGAAGGEAPSRPPNQSDWQPPPGSA